MKTKGLIAAALLFIIAYLTYNYMYQDHRNILQEDASFNISSSELFETFNSKPELANKKFINTVIEFHGTISKLNEEFIIIHPNIFCTLDSSLSSSNLNLGDTLLLKGRCVGFDDLFMEVKIDNVSFTTNK